MVGDQIKYEPIWNLSSKKRALKATAVNDCLSSVTAGLTSQSIHTVQRRKSEQYLAS